MICVHVVGDEELSTPDHRVCDDQLATRICRKGDKNKLHGTFNFDKPIVLPQKSNKHRLLPSLSSHS